MEGHRFMGGIHAHESWGPYALQRGLNAISYNDPIGERQRPSLQGRESKAIGYGPVWTRIFEYLTIGLDGYRKVEIGEDNYINERTLKMMRRQLEQQGQGVDEVEEEVDRMEQEDQGHQQPQAQATMLDLVQEMKRIIENLQAFQIETQGQYQSMNTRIGRVERSVRAIHDHLGIHYEDVDEDED
ncbi:hypothetical protein PIB30_108262 [Stylosanthes scabra]|uniref:Uncharacterized protein n=1 Tax=Stylosanthes scabra TaxID=79078 RepID=A0ABU6QZJ4_9FABA|nr:hypothetical protein [Stylosanthes scabra]